MNIKNLMLKKLFASGKLFISGMCFFAFSLFGISDVRSDRDPQEVVEVTHKSRLTEDGFTITVDHEEATRLWGVPSIEQVRAEYEAILKKEKKKRSFRIWVEGAVSGAIGAVLYFFFIHK